MRKLLFLLVLIAIISFANAQENKPSKEETIAWIKEKIENTPQKNVRKVKVESINECQIMLTFTMPGYSDFRVTIPTIGTNGNFFNTNKVIKNEYLDDGEIVFTNYVEGFDFPNIYDRLDKAIKHLASFCNKKPEPF